MNFKDQGLPLSKQGLEQTCDTLGVSAPEVWAVLTVETGGFGFFQDRRPKILFERHIFHKLTNGKFDAGNPDISNAEPGGYMSGQGEYPRLQKAMGMDEEAALQSASWGIGQVMGFNHALVGYAHVHDMVTAMVADESTQLLAMAKFIKGTHLDTALQARNWAGFALGYNGKEFKENRYDERLEKAHGKYMTTLPDLTLRTAQAALLYLGFNPGPIDGLRGPSTRAALMQFQQQSGLATSGELDQDSESKLLAAAFAKETI